MNAAVCIVMYPKAFAVVLPFHSASTPPPKIKVYFRVLKIKN